MGKNISLVKHGIDNGVDEFLVHRRDLRVLAGRQEFFDCLVPGGQTPPSLVGIQPIEDVPVERSHAMPG